MLSISLRTWSRRPALAVTAGIVAIAMWTLSPTLSAAADGDSCVLSTDKLVSWWSFDDGTAADVADGNDGVVHSGVPVKGKVGDALSFSGSSRRIDVPDNRNLRLNKPFTIGAWIRTTASGDPQMVMIKGGQATDSVFCRCNYFLRVEPDGKIVFIVRSAEGAPDFKQAEARSAMPVNDGKYHHVFGVFDGDKVFLYVDGVEVASDASIAASFQEYGVMTSDEQLNIGYYSHTGDPKLFFHGVIDEVRIYARALTPDEIACKAGRSLLWPYVGDDTPEASLLIYDEDPVEGEPREVILRKFGAKQATTFRFQTSGDPVQLVPLPAGRRGTGFFSPADDEHGVPFNLEGDTSWAPTAVAPDTVGDECHSVWWGGPDADLVILNPGSETLDATVCADDQAGGPQGCTRMNKIPGQGGVILNLQDGLGKCSDPPCMARVVSKTPGGGLGCATLTRNGSVASFGGFGVGLEGDEFYTPIGDTVAVGNLGPQDGDVEVFDLDGAQFDGQSLGPLGTAVLDGAGGLDPSAIFTDGFESGDVSVWSMVPGEGDRLAEAAVPHEGVRGVSPADGAQKKAVVIFPLNSDAVTAQLGLLNMGKGNAKLTIFFRDKTGTKLGKKKMTLKKGSSELVDLPGKATGEEGSYAEITVTGTKVSVWPYALLEHIGSGDITIVPGIIIS